jgi:hypothetical protein
MRLFDPAQVDEMCRMAYVMGKAGLPYKPVTDAPACSEEDVSSKNIDDEGEPLKQDPRVQDPEFIPMKHASTMPLHPDAELVTFPKTIKNIDEWGMCMVATGTYKQSRYADLSNDYGKWLTCRDASSFRAASIKDVRAYFLMKWKLKGRPSP